MAVIRDITLRGRDAWSRRVNFLRGGVALDVSGDTWIATIRERDDRDSDELEAFEVTEESASVVTFSLTSPQVEAMPKVAWYWIVRLVGGDPEREQTIFEGRVRHE